MLQGDQASDAGHGGASEEFVCANDNDSHLPLQAPADNPCARFQVCTSRRLLEIDIRMPEPRPSVTIAVPP